MKHNNTRQNINLKKEFLQDDQVVHEKRYQCTYPGCKKQFKGKGNLIIHQRKHVILYRLEKNLFAARIVISRL